ncbi:unnamed protein product [Effrenium voratum]|nr:unnamed protein product [Effrenium voratum]
MAPALRPGGYSSEALSYAEALQKAYQDSDRGAHFGLRQFAEHMSHEFVKGLPDSLTARLSTMVQEGRQARTWDVVICHSTPDVWHEDGAFGWGKVEPCPPKGAKFRIGRTMYETDKVPASWVPRISRMDQVWVPSHFGLEQFVASGVPREKIRVVPEAVDTALFDPSKHSPLQLGGESSYRFLSVFKWEKRKGWDILLKAYFEEFSQEDDVILVLKTQSFHSGDDFHQKVLKEIHSAQAGRQPAARYQLLSEDLALKDLPRLYRAADAFVLPTRGEGWGRPHVEAMSMALPVIATNWSGSTEFLSESAALPLPITGLEPAELPLPSHADHRWAVPDAEALRRLMRWAFEHQPEAKELGQDLSMSMSEPRMLPLSGDEAARAHMLQNFSPEVVVARHVLPLLREAYGSAKSEL